MSFLNTSGSYKETLREWRTPSMYTDPKDRDKGLYPKFQVFRADGRDAPGHKHDRCGYFVLDLTHDPHASAALKAYANALPKEFQALAIDLMKMAYRIDEDRRRYGEVRFNTKMEEQK
jgi:hypothetical protein